MQHHAIHKSTNKLDPITPADNPKSGNAFSTGACPRRCNLDLDTNRILAGTAMASRIASLHARPGPLRGAGGDRRRWAAVCARVPAFDAMMITAKATSLTGGFTVALPSPLGSAGTKRNPSAAIIGSEQAPIKCVICSAETSASAGLVSISREYMTTSLGPSGKIFQPAPRAMQFRQR